MKKNTPAAGKLDLITQSPNTKTSLSKKIPEIRGVLIPVFLTVGCAFCITGTAISANKAFSGSSAANLEDEISEVSFMDKVADSVEEYAWADYKYLSDSLYVAISQKSTDSGVYYLTHVLLSDASQIHGAMSYDDWGGTRQLCTEVSAEKNAVLVTNGSYFSYDSGEPICASVFISDGEIMQNGTANGDEVCLKSDGTLYTPKAGTSASDLVSDGVIFSWGTADPVLISDGEALSITSSDTDQAYPRTAYGMVEPCEYYIITAGESSYDNGLTFAQMQEIFQSCGCTYARSLDGGGAASLVFDGALLNSPAAGEERAVVDFVYFTDLEES